MTVIKKRSRKDGINQLVIKTKAFVECLKDQRDYEAAADLEIAVKDLERFDGDSLEAHAAIRLILEAFEGEHELVSYTYAPKQSAGGVWDERQELFLLATTVRQLVKHLSEK